MHSMKPNQHPRFKAFAVRILSIGLLGLGSFAASAQTGSGTQVARPKPSSNDKAAASKPVVAQPKVHQWVLPNGLTVIVKPDRRAPTAVHMLWVRVGAMDEVDGTSGVAHALEHMMFKGTKTLKPGEFSRKVAALGGRENAFTSRDVTAYHQQIPSNRLADVMALEADRFANNQWSDEEFRKEIEVIKEERRMRTEDEPRAQMYEVLNATSYMASPYRRPIIGWMNDLDNMKPDDLREFYRRWYVPANAAVVIAGDVDVNQVRDLVAKTYGKIPARPVPARKPREEPEQKGIRRIEFKASAEQAYVSLAFKVPGLNSFKADDEEAKDALALTVLAAILDGYPNARLVRALTQGENKLADDVGAYHSLTARGPKQFVLDGVPMPGKTTAQIEAALRAEVARIAREGVSEAELARVKTQWVSSQIYRLDSVFYQGRELGTYWSLGLPLDAGEQLIARLKTVTSAQVQAVAAKYFGDDALTVGTLLPQPIAPNKKPRAKSAGSRH
jgi:zinc protease